MRRILIILACTTNLFAQQLPVVQLPAPLSPRSRELALQRADVRALRTEQRVFQEEAINWLVDVELSVENSKLQFKNLDEEVKKSRTEQADQNRATRVRENLINAAANARQTLARLNYLRDMEIATLSRAQETQREQYQRLLNAIRAQGDNFFEQIEAQKKLQSEQAQQSKKQQAELQSRIEAAEQSNYRLKWVLGTVTAIGATAAAIFGYKLWQNQQALEENQAALQLLCDKNKIPGQLTRVDMSKYLTQEQLKVAQEELQKLCALNKIIPKKDEKGVIIGFTQGHSDVPWIFIPEGKQAAADKSYVTREEFEAFKKSLPTIRRVIDIKDNILIEFTDPNAQPRTGASSYSGAFWPNDKFTKTLKP